jgi:hypothetical protein
MLRDSLQFFFILCILRSSLWSSLLLDLSQVTHKCLERLIDLRFIIYLFFKRFLSTLQFSFHNGDAFRDKNEGEMLVFSITDAVLTEKGLFHVSAARRCANEVDILLLT